MLSRLRETHGQLPAPKIYFFIMGMRSLKQIEASRSNGAKSRGPVREKEALAADRAALRYQLLSETIVLPGESEARFIDLVKSLVRTFFADVIVFY